MHGQQNINQKKKVDLFMAQITNQQFVCVLLRLYVCGYSVGLDSSVGIASTLRAGRYGDRIPVGARLSAPVHTGPRAHPASYPMGTGSFPGVRQPGVTLTTHPV